MKSSWHRQSLFFILLMLGHIFLVSAGERAYEPIILTGKQLMKFLGTPLDELYLMVYHDSLSSWDFIPFQIDERQPIIQDGDTSYSYFAAGDGLLEPFDELVFMMKDLGDQADADNWPAFSDKPSPLKRHEITVADTLNGEQRALGFAYLFQGQSPGHPRKDYLTVDPLTDKIISRFYAVGFLPESGLPDFLQISPENGGDNQDFLDRLKIRLQMTMSVLGTVRITEDAIHKVEPPRYITGPVRIIRDVPFNIRIDLGTTGEIAIQDTFHIILQFFPYSMLVGIPDLDLSPVQEYGTLNRIRLTFDYNGYAQGMKFLNEKNEFVIDGQMSAEELAMNRTLTVPGFNWILVSGEHGSMVTITSVPALGDTTELYYNDSKTPDLEDTGDLVSFGDSGFYIAGNITPGVFDFISTAYFLPATITRKQAINIFRNYKNPLYLSLTYQKNLTSVEATDGNIPSSLSLLRIYPNPLPFCRRGALTIHLQLQQGQSLQIEIFDLLGRKLFQSPERKYPEGVNSLSLDLNSLLPKPPATGVYWLVVKGDSQFLREKFLVLK